MTLNRRLLPCGALFLTVLAMKACMIEVHAGQRAADLPKVRVGIGMSLDELKRGSTYPFATAPSIDMGSDFQAFQITTPYNLVYVDNSAELRLDNLGGVRELTDITISQGKVSTLTVTVQTGRTNVHDVLQQAKGLYMWFMDHGYVTLPGNYMFRVESRNSKQEISPITSFEQAESVLLDPGIKLSELDLFGLKKIDINVGVSLANGRRMRAKYNKQYDDESNAKDEKQYSLTMFIAETVKPYRPSSRTKVN